MIFFIIEKLGVISKIAQKEVEVLNKLKELDSNLLVRYYHSWIDRNNVHILMDYCFDNLKNVLPIKPIVFERSENQAMNSIEYFISCEIFRQITEALNYLHSLKPKPLIHRDLKPANILIGMSGNKRICKLADFGLSKFIEDSSASHTQGAGTHGYMAPEVATGQRYDHKADIYSLGMIALKLFDTSNNKPNEGKYLAKIFSSTISQKIEAWDRLISDKMVTASRSRRMPCQEILMQIRKLGINKKSIPLNELKLYYKKSKENDLKYFSDIIINNH